MKSFKLLLFLFVAINPGLLSAEFRLDSGEPSIHWGNPNPNSGKGTPQKLIGRLNDNLVFLTRERRTLFDNEKQSLELIPLNNIGKKIQIEIPLEKFEDKKNLSVEKIFILNQNVILIASHLNKKKK
jgi:hypothetical protein